jgi:hypothetical protein
MPGQKILPHFEIEFFSEAKVFLNFNNLIRIFTRNKSLTKTKNSHTHKLAFEAR